MLAVCHTVIPEGDASPSEIKYQCESPDEAAFVVAAKNFGFFFFKRSMTKVHIMEPTGPRGAPQARAAADPPACAGASRRAPLNYPSPHAQERIYEILAVLEFNSTRKRMSVVVRDDAGKLLLMCKGADSVIYQRLAPAPANSDKGVCSQHMDEFAQASPRLGTLYALRGAAQPRAWGGAPAPGLAWLASDAAAPCGRLACARCASPTARSTLPSSPPGSRSTKPPRPAWWGARRRLTRRRS